MTSEDMRAVHNLGMLGVQPDTKKSVTGAFALKFELHKVKQMFTFELMVLHIDVMPEIFLFKLSEEAGCKKRTCW